MANNKKPPAPPTAPAPTLVPTPEVGDQLWYYAQGDGNLPPQAAVCTQVEGVGRIKCTIFNPIGPPHTKQGVYFMDLEPDERKKQQKMFKQSGGWRFKGNRFPKHAYEYHQDKLHRIGEQRVKEADQAELDRKRQEEEAAKQNAGSAA